MPELILDRGGLAAVPITPPRLPVRHQRSRKRGARTPDGVVYVGRPTIFGNPFDHRRFGHARSVRLFGQWLDRRAARRHPARARIAHDTPWSQPPRRTILRRPPESRLVAWGRRADRWIPTACLALVAILVATILLPALHLVFD